MIFKNYIISKKKNMPIPLEGNFQIPQLSVINPKREANFASKKGKKRVLKTGESRALFTNFFRKHSKQSNGEFNSPSFSSICSSLLSVSDTSPCCQKCMPALLFFTSFMQFSFLSFLFSF